MSNLKPYYHFKLDFQNVGQHRRGKWLINGTKRRNDNQLQKPPKKSKGNMLNSIFKENVEGQKHPGSCAFAEPELFM